MTAFYILPAEGRGIGWLLGQEDDGERRFFGWLPNTQRWYRVKIIEDVFYAPTPDAGTIALVPVDAATVRAK